MKVKHAHWHGPTAIVEYSSHTNSAGLIFRNKKPVISTPTYQRPTDLPTTESQVAREAETARARGFPLNTWGDNVVRFDDINSLYVIDVRHAGRKLI
jgi:hypothetical protein